jgi:hypothetical protein
LLKTPPEKIHLEYTFEGPSGKNPEVMVDDDSGPVYFEVTSVEDYNQMNMILHYFNILTAFQVSLNVLQKLHRQITITFSKFPTENMFRSIYWALNRSLAAGISLFDTVYEDYRISMAEGENVTFNIPTKYLEQKIKDKIEEKTGKFKPGERNYIVIDVTAIVTDIEAQLSKVREYFDYSGNKTVWGVLLQSKRWAFEGFEPVYKFQLICQANSTISGKEPFKTISRLIPG